MDYELPKGTLVWVEPKVNATNLSQVMVNRHGKLWVIDCIAMRRDAPSRPAWYWCRSMTDGYTYDWREDELIVAKEDENAE